jgi:hypothetical protein
MNTVVQLRRSRSEKPTVQGGRAKNADYRQRERPPVSRPNRIPAFSESANGIEERTSLNADAELQHCHRLFEKLFFEGLPFSFAQLGFE